MREIFDIFAPNKILTLNKNAMKRIFIMITCAALLAACGESKKEENKQSCDKAKCEQTNCDKQECKKDECQKQECDKQDCNKEKCKKLPAGCITLDAEDFAKQVADLSQLEWKYLGDKPAVVDFYADWCGPCRSIAPYLEEIAKEYDGKLYVYKINIDNDPEIADAFNITGIPTLLFIPMEGRYSVKVGSMDKEALQQLVVENCFK